MPQPAYISIYMFALPTTRKTAHFAHVSITVIRQRLRKSKNPKNQKIQNFKNPKIQKSKNLNIQKPENLKIQKAKTFTSMESCIFLDFWTLGF